MLIDLFKGGNDFATLGGGHNPPAYAVLIKLLNLFTKWAPGIGCFRRSACRPAGKSRRAHRNQGEGPKFKVLAQIQMLITHIAGANKNLLICILNQLN